MQKKTSRQHAQTLRHPHFCRPRQRLPEFGVIGTMSVISSGRGIHNMTLASFWTAFRWYGRHNCFVVRRHCGIHTLFHSAFSKALLWCELHNVQHFLFDRMHGDVHILIRDWFCDVQILNLLPGPLLHSFTRDRPQCLNSLFPQPRHCRALVGRLLHLLLWDQLHLDCLCRNLRHCRRLDGRLLLDPVESNSHPARPSQYPPCPDASGYPYSAPP